MIDRQASKNLAVHLILDNYATKAQTCSGGWLGTSGSTCSSPRPRSNQRLRCVGVRVKVFLDRGNELSAMASPAPPGHATTTLLDGIVTPDQPEAGGAAIELSGYVLAVLAHFEKASTSAEQGLIGDLAARYAAGELEQLPALGMMLTLLSTAGRWPSLCWPMTSVKCCRGGLGGRSPRRRCCGGVGLCWVAQQENPTRRSLLSWMCRSRGGQVAPAAC
jgi:hypothetical protein